MSVRGSRLLREISYERYPCLPHASPLASLDLSSLVKYIHRANYRAPDGATPEPRVSVHEVKKKKKRKKNTSFYHSCVVS